MGTTRVVHGCDYCGGYMKRCPHCGSTGELLSVVEERDREETLYTVRARWTDDDGQTQTRWFGDNDPTATCRARDKADAAWMRVGVARIHLDDLARRSPAVTFALIATPRPSVVDAAREGR